MQSKGSQAKTFADLSDDQKAKFFAAISGKTPTATLKSDPNADLPPMPTNVKADDKGRTDANKQDGKPSGIKEAAPADNKNFSIKPNTSIVPNIGGIKGPTNLPAGLEEPSADPYSKMSIEEIAAKKLAFLGGDVRKEERAGLMAERASAKDEARRAQSLRMAEFFAAWGSTPGSTINAGLSALKTKLPDIITDSREEAKIRRAINKDIAALDKADRLEKSGAWDEAAKIKQDQAKNAYNVWGKKIDYLSARESDQSRITAAQITQSGKNNENKQYTALVGKRTEIEKAITTKLDKLDPMTKTFAAMESSKDPKTQAQITAAKAKVATLTGDLEKQREEVQGVIDRIKKIDPNHGLDNSVNTAAPAGNRPALSTFQTKG